MLEENPYIENRKKQNIRPIIIPNKKKLYWDLMNIENSWSGRMDTNIGNTFIMEAHQLLINSIELFEMGYFDCAYFSLRSAVDISTTMVFLCDITEEKREEYFEKWKTQDSFPKRFQMIKELTGKGEFFCDMYENMPSFFLEAQKTSEALNKFVHKQGLCNFYISRNHPVFKVKSQEAFVNNYLSFLKKVIGIVAVMRLAIDPFPVLLMDEDILYRCFDSMTEAYTEEFVKEYIGSTIIQGYKKTSIFRGAYDALSENEKKTEPVFDVVKHQYINTEKYDEIKKQFHLMDVYDVTATVLAHSCNKITRIYTMGGFLFYFTERKTKSIGLSVSGEEFKKLSSLVDRINLPYHKVFISVFKVGNEDYFAEHNDLLEETEVKFIESELEVLRTIE